MAALADEIDSALRRLIGLRMTLARNAGDMKVLHFGEVRPHPKRGTMGEYALHIQCPWRLVTAERIVTGSTDTEPSLQDRRFLDLFGGDPETRSHENRTPWLVVEGVRGDPLGGAKVHLSGGYSLEILPVGTNEADDDENWRLLKPYGEHFVFRPNGVFER